MSCRIGCMNWFIQSVQPPLPRWSPKNLDVFVEKGKKQVTNMNLKFFQWSEINQTLCKRLSACFIQTRWTHRYLYFFQDPILLNLSSKKKFGVIFIIGSSPKYAFYHQTYSFFHGISSINPFLSLSATTVPRPQTSSLFSWINSSYTSPSRSRWYSLLLLNWLSPFLGGGYYFPPCLWPLRTKIFNLQFKAHSMGSPGSLGVLSFLLRSPSVPTTFSQKNWCDTSFIQPF